MAEDKKYGASAIPARPQAKQNTDGGSAGKAPAASDKPQFYEIEYGACPIDGVGKYVAKPDKIKPPPKDGIREHFYAMRDIAVKYRSPFTESSSFFDGRVQRDNARIFFRQAEFMYDFEDDYGKTAELSAYYPNYQMMNYEQLRTYFTWRSRVRKGDIQKTSLSYAFVYIYELVNNVGDLPPKQTLEKLVEFRREYGAFEPQIEKYIARWIRDFCIYYDMQQPFGEIIEEFDLTALFPHTESSDDEFELFSKIAKYDIRKSAFYADNKELIANCFSFVMERVREAHGAAGIKFDRAIFNPGKKRTPWKPFRDALFYRRDVQRDRNIVVSDREIYICARNEWIFSSIVTGEKGSRFLGYVFKRMESLLRKSVGYKRNITAELDMISPDTLEKLNKQNIFIETIVKKAVEDFLKERTKTVVTVDAAALERIRKEALETQEALIVDEPEEQEPVISEEQRNTAEAIFNEETAAEPPDSWAVFRDSLDETELRAIAVAADGGSITSFAAECGIMAEVLIDGINEKAVDCIGDAVLDGDATVFEDYLNQIKAMLEGI